MRTPEFCNPEKVPGKQAGYLLVGDNTTLTTVFGRAIDQFMSIPAVGAAGRTTPVKAFSPQ